MASPEIASTFGPIFFDGHLWVAKTNQLDLGAFFGKNSAFFVFTRCSFRLVKTRECFASVFYSSGGRPRNVFCSGH